MARSALVDLRRRNEWAVVEALRVQGSLTRPQLVTHTGLSRSTIANVVLDLQRRGLLDERARAPDTRPGPGRFGAVISLPSLAGAAIGIAIDRESIRCAAIDLAGRVLSERVEPIAPDAAGAAIIARCEAIVRSLVGEIALPVQRIVGVGIGLPGPVDRVFGGVHPTATLGRWAGLDVRSELSGRLDGVHVYPDNDANYGALGEQQFGAGRGVENLIYVRIGPGIGGGLVIDGNLHRGDLGFAGEIGHITAVGDGAPCPCGRRGCLSTVASSGAVADRLAPTHGADLPPARILALEAAGDPHAIAALTEAGGHVGRVLSALVNALNPAMVILGGELGAGSEQLLKAAGRVLTEHIQPIAGHALRVQHARFADRSEVLGAGARVLRDSQRVRAFVAAA